MPDIPAPPPRITGLGGCRETLRELGGTARSRPRLPDSGKKLQETSPKAADYLQKRPVLQETYHLLDLLLHSVSLWGGQLPLLPATSTPRRALQSSNAEIARNRRARARRWCQTLPGLSYTRCLLSPTGVHQINLSRRRIGHLPLQTARRGQIRQQVSTQNAHNGVLLDTYLLGVLRVELRFTNFVSR